MQELRELRLEAAGARRREASLKDAHAARIAQLEREIQKLKPAALHAKDLEARLADREQRVHKLRAEVPFLSPTCEGHACVMFACHLLPVTNKHTVMPYNASTLQWVHFMLSLSVSPVAP